MALVQVTPNQSRDVIRICNRMDQKCINVCLTND